MGVSDKWQNFHFGVEYSFNNQNFKTIFNNTEQNEKYYYINISL